MSQLPHDLLAAVRASAHTRVAFAAEDSDESDLPEPWPRRMSVSFASAGKVGLTAKTDHRSGWRPLS